MTNFRQIFENDWCGIEVFLKDVLSPVFGDYEQGYDVLTNEPEVCEKAKNANITEIRHAATFDFFGSELKVFDITVGDNKKLENNKVGIQALVRQYINQFEGALIIFHHQNVKNQEWRFSFIEKRINAKDSTSAKRYTYILGRHLPARTISERFAYLEAHKDVLTLKDLTDAFSVESLTKEFFGQLFTWYSDWACKVCKFPSDKCIAANADLTTEKNEINLIRLITRIMFVWFIKQKNLIPTWIFNKNELAEILADADLSSDKKGNYYNAVLQNLFFGALNKKIEERTFAEVSKAGVANEQYGIKTYFRDANEGSFFKLSPKEMVKKFLDVPFLNGGLFECLDWDEPIKNNTSHKVHYVDGFSRDKDRRAFVPNILFWNEDEKQPGLITILSRYNFTVEESTPSDVQVALDPELLGKIFENLLGTYNPETRESARKESGSFYTPREIVSYMVNSSIKAYLQEKVPDVSEENLERLTNDNKADDSEIKLTEEQINKIRSALFEIKIIDPACGSGAFPMGILNKLVEIHVLLDKLSASTKSEHNLYIKKGQSVNYNPDESLKINAEYLGNQEFKLCVNGKEENTIYNSQDLALHVKEIINRHNKKLGKNTIANLFSQGRIDDGKSFNSIKTKTDIHQIVDEDTKDIIWQYRSYNVKNKFRQYRNEEKQALSINTAEEDNDFEYAKYLYSLKTRIIQDSIFGVDIQPIAVQISKLRFFISLICEQPKIENHPEENYGYNPLPNLETKFVAANTLIGKAKKTDDMALFANPKIDEITKKLGEIRKVHFSAKTAQEKKENREEDEKLRKELSKLLEEEQVYSPEDAKQLAEWNPYDQSAPASSFFDAEWMFGVKDGFDVVIGNPPYIKEYTSKSAFDGFRETSPYYMGKMDLWYGFACHGIDLLKTKGMLCFIAQNNWTTSSGAKLMRKKVLEDSKILQMLDFNTYMVFESADIQTMVMLFEKNTTADKYTFDYRTLLAEADKDDMLSLIQKQSTGKTKYLTPKIDRTVLNGKLLTFSCNDDILEKIASGKLFLQADEATNGIHTHHDCVNNKIHREFPDLPVGKAIFVLTQSEKDALNLSKNEFGLVKPFYASDEISRYYTNPKNKNWIIYTGSEFKKENSMDSYPNLKAHLDCVKKAITSDNAPYGLHRAREEHFFKGAKIVSLRKCVDKPCFSYSEFDCYVPAMYYVIQTSRWNMKFLTGVLNSKLIAFWLKNKGKMQGSNYQVDKEPLLNIPLPSATPAQQKPIIALVDKILAAKKANPQAGTSKDEAKIDCLVYALYGLTEDEIKIVEGR